MIPHEGMAVREAAREAARAAAGKALITAIVRPPESSLSSSSLESPLGGCLRAKGAKGWVIFNFAKVVVGSHGGGNLDSCSYVGGNLDSVVRAHHCRGECSRPYPLTHLDRHVQHLRGGRPNLGLRVKRREILTNRGGFVEEWPRVGIGGGELK